MRLDGNGVIITGGGSGIGRALARAWLDAGSDVLVCGRREDKLRAVQAELPKVRTFLCDVSKRADREALVRHATSELPALNVLVNNAGVQRETSFLAGAPELADGESELDINLAASLHLAALCVPLFYARGRPSAVVNVTSGLAFIPIKTLPVYCATKAGLHAFSVSLRSQLAHTEVRVFEIIPPLVQTELHRGEAARRQGAKGITAERVAAATMRAIAKDRFEVAIGQARDLKVASRIAPHFFHRLLNRVAT